MKQTRRAFAGLILLLFLLHLTGCPRFAYIALYNNTGFDVILLTGGHRHDVASGATVVFKFTGWSLEAESELGRWTYERAIPHDGKDGAYFDGTLRLQLNKDGHLYALQVKQAPPILNFTEQPHGYPLSPAAGPSTTSN
jgi:hypothetical protein